MSIITTITLSVAVLAVAALTITPILSSLKKRADRQELARINSLPEEERTRELFWRELTRRQRLYTAARRNADREEMERLQASWLHHCQFSGIRGAIIDPENWFYRLS